MASNEILSFIPTKSSLIKRKKPEEFKAVVFESYKAKPKKQKLENDVQEISDSKTNEINMKKARHEVLKFGMSGFDPQKKEEAKIQLAISLGAKPPKNKYKNYKQLLQDKKKEREAEQKRLDFEQLGKNKLGKSNAKGKSFDRKRRKGKGGLLDIYGKPTLKEVTKSKTK